LVPGKVVKKATLGSKKVGKGKKRKKKKKTEVDARPHVVSEFRVKKFVKGFEGCFRCLQELTIVQAPTGCSVVCPKGILQGISRLKRMLVPAEHAATCDGKRPSGYTLE
jgi:hypothetical protein